MLVEAFYDSTAWVAGLSPGADEASGVATLLFVAQYLKDHPPQRTVILAATSGHARHWPECGNWYGALPRGR